MSPELNRPDFLTGAVTTTTVQLPSVSPRNQGPSAPPLLAYPIGSYEPAPRLRERALWFQISRKHLGPRCPCWSRFTVRGARQNIIDRWQQLGSLPAGA